MATEIVTRVLCDFCAADDKTTPNAETLAVSLNGATFEVDVCPTHRKPLDDLAETLAEHGRKIPKSASANGGKSSAETGGPGVTCPACGKTYKYRKHLTSHARNVHGTTLAELEGQPLEYKCEWCSRAFSTPQGVAVHEQRAHSLEWHARKVRQENS